MSNKIPRRGFLAIIFGSFAALLVSQATQGKVIAEKTDEAAYGNGPYGGR